MEKKEIKKERNMRSDTKRQMSYEYRLPSGARSGALSMLRRGRTHQIKDSYYAYDAAESAQIFFVKSKV